jgi:hypothetical protein
MAARTKGGNIILSDVRVPDYVEPGESFEVEAVVSNGALAIAPWDPDYCGNYSTDEGYKIAVEFEGPDGRSVTKRDCIGMTEVGTRDVTYTATFTAAQSGAARVEALVRMPGSGKETAVVSASADVTEQAPEQSDGPTPGDGDSSGGGNPWDLDDDNPIPDGGDVGLGVVLALVLVGFVLVSSGGPSLTR